MAKRIIVVGVIQSYVVNDDANVADLIRSDIADTIQEDPLNFIVCDITDDLAARMLYKTGRIKMTEIDDLITDKTLCFTCVKKAIDQAVKDYIDDVPEDDPWRKECYEMCVGYGPKGEEYAEEVEHQDGYGYWRQFKTLDDVAKDLQRYIEATASTSTSTSTSALE